MGMITHPQIFQPLGMGQTIPGKAVGRALAGFILSFVPHLAGGLVLGGGGLSIPSRKLSPVALRFQITDML